MEKGNRQHNGGKFIPCVESYNKIFLKQNPGQSMVLILHIHLAKIHECISKHILQIHAHITYFFYLLKGDLYKEIYVSQKIRYGNNIINKF